MNDCGKKFMLLLFIVKFQIMVFLFYFMSVIITFIWKVNIKLLKSTVKSSKLNSK